jgi:hypothetical protein
MENAVLFKTPGKAFLFKSLIYPHVRKPCVIEGGPEFLIRKGKVTSYSKRVSETRKGQAQHRFLGRGRWMHQWRRPRQSPRFPVRAKAAGKYVANARGFIDKRLRTSPSAPPWACTCAAEQCQLEGVARHDWRRGGETGSRRCSTWTSLFWAKNNDFGQCSSGEGHSPY